MRAVRTSYFDLWVGSSKSVRIQSILLKSLIRRPSSARLAIRQDHCPWKQTYHFVHLLPALLPLMFQSGLVPFFTHLCEVWSFTLFLEVSHTESGSGYQMTSLENFRKLPFSIWLTSVLQYFMMHLRAREMLFSPKLTGKKKKVLGKMWMFHKMCFSQKGQLSILSIQPRNRC